MAKSWATAWHLDAATAPWGNLRPASVSAHRRALTRLIVWGGLWLALAVVAGCGLVYNSLPLSINPSNVTFGDVPVGQSQQASITLHNNGLRGITLNSIAAESTAFSVSPGALPMQIAAGAQATVAVTFRPQAAVDYRSSIAVVAESGSTKVDVSGSGKGTGGGNTPNRILQTSTSGINFGEQTVGTDAQQVLTLTSTGTDPVAISSIVSSDASFTMSGITYPATLQHGQTLSLPVTFHPSVAGLVSAQLTVQSDAATANLAVGMTGTGVAMAQPAPAAPGVSLSATELDFGSVAVQGRADAKLTITSSGTAPLVLNSLQLAGGEFSLDSVPLPSTLAVGQSLSLSLHCSPSSTGVAEGSLTLGDNVAGPAAVVGLRGKGTSAPARSLSVTPGLLDFGDVTTGASVAKTVTLVATGNQPVTIDTLTATGSGFRLAPQTLPMVLAPGQQVSLSITLDPATTGAQVGTLAIHSDDNKAPSVQVTLTGQGVIPAAPSLSVSEATLSFGQQTVGSPATLTLTVTSTGTAAAQILSGSVSGAAFAASYAGVPLQSLSAPIVLQPGQLATFRVSFLPGTIGAAQGQLTLLTDAGSPIVIALTGSGEAVPVAKLTLSTSALDFGGVQQGTTASRSVTLTSSGTAAVTIASVSIAGASFSVASIVDPPGTAGLPAILQPGQVVVLQIAFAPTQTGASSGSVLITDDASGGPLSVSLAGTGTAVPVPALRASATSLDFGTVSVGSSSTQTLTLTSNGTAPVTISALALSGPPFTLAPTTLPIQLQPGQQVQLQVTFPPQMAGPATATLSITSNVGAGPLLVSLGGSGVAAPVPVLNVSSTSLAFGPVAVGANAAQSLVLSNTGQAPLTVQALQVTGGAFQVSAPALPVVLQAGQQASVSVLFAPAAAGNATGSLAISSNGGNATVPLSGSGTVAAVPVLSTSTNALSLGSVAVGSTASSTVTLANTGTAVLTVQTIVETGAAFQASPSGPLTLQPGQQATLQITFAPTAVGSATGLVTISSNGGNATVSLSGSGTAVLHEADLAWNPPASSPDPVAGYNIYRSTLGGTPALLNSAPVDASTYIDKAVTSGATYQYTVRSADQGGQESDDSNQISLTIP